MIADPVVVWATWLWKDDACANRSASGGVSNVGSQRFGRSKCQHRVESDQECH